ncbi:hypothetical protein [Ewingella americana]
MNEAKIYAERDLMILDAQGDHYCRHIVHMTCEDLHSKSDIAAELGWRDLQIQELTQQNSALQLSQGNIINGLGITGDGPESRRVIEYVMGLVSESLALRKAHPQPFGPAMMKAIDAFEARAESVPEEGMLNAFFILRDSIVLTQDQTDAFIAEIGAKAVEAEFSRNPDAEIKWDGTDLTVQNVRDGLSFGVTPVFTTPQKLVVLDDATILAWGERNYIQRDVSTLRCIIDDAISLPAAI